MLDENAVRIRAIACGNARRLLETRADLRDAATRQQLNASHSRGCVRLAIAAQDPVEAEAERSAADAEQGHRSGLATASFVAPQLELVRPERQGHAEHTDRGEDG